jgi:hypothetical protein
MPDDDGVAAAELHPRGRRVGQYSKSPCVADLRVRFDIGHHWALLENLT